MWKSVNTSTFVAPPSSRIVETIVADAAALAALVGPLRAHRRGVRRLVDRLHPHATRGRPRSSGRA
jgi:hypothetical protein